MRPDQLDAFVTPSQPAISPDGRTVLVSISRIDFEEDRYDRSIHRWEASTGLVPFTTGPGDTSPVWSPDGSRFAFLRAVDDVPQVAVMPADGGEARVVSSAPKGVRAVEWTPDGSALVAHWVEWAEGWDLPDEERARTPRRITKAPYRFDNLGWTHDTRHRVTVLDPVGVADPRHLTDPIERLRGVAVHGERVVFLADLSDRPIGDSLASVHAVPLAGGAEAEVAGPGAWQLVLADGGEVVVVGQPSLDDLPGNAVPHRLGPDGPRPLDPGLDRSTLLVFAGALAPAMVPDGVVAPLEDGGRVGIVRITDGSTETLVGGDRSVTGLSATPDGSKVAFTASTPTDPGALWLWEEGAERCLALPNDGLDGRVPLVAGERMVVDGAGGPIDAWVFLPPGDEPVPLLLNIHGGPASQYGDGFFDEFQVYVGAGFGVVACNPRGSSGRGTEWVRAVVTDGWGRDDLADILAVVDAALGRHPRLDADRMGLMGGSYGGFMTAWITARDQRWRSAVVERALTSFPSFWGTSDIGTHFTEIYFGGASMPGDLDTLWEMSPLSTAHRTVTPTLVLHSELDLRCPIEQAEQYFVALLRAGTPVEMLRFPGGSHELSRSGKPSHRRVRLEAVVEWHGRWLGVPAPEVAD